MNTVINNGFLKVKEDYRGIMNELRQFSETHSEKELIQMQLDYFYNITNKQLRLMFISDFKDYIVTLEKEEVDYSESSGGDKSTFIDIEEKIRLNPMNDGTVNFIIKYLLREHESCESYKLRKTIARFMFELVIKMQKLTAMNYTSGNEGGYVLYVASFKNDATLYEIKPNAIFAYTHDFSKKRCN